MIVVAAFGAVMMVGIRPTTSVEYVVFGGAATLSGWLFAAYYILDDWMYWTERWLGYDSEETEEGA